MFSLYMMRFVIVIINKRIYDRVDPVVVHYLQMSLHAISLRKNVLNNLCMKHHYTRHIDFKVRLAEFRKNSSKILKFN